MNNRLPGFTAEVSLSKTKSHYRSTGAVPGPQGNLDPDLVTPAQQYSCSTFFQLCGQNQNCMAYFKNKSDYYNAVLAQYSSLGICNDITTQPYDACNTAVLCDGNTFLVAENWWATGDWSCYCYNG